MLEASQVRLRDRSRPVLLIERQCPVTRDPDPEAGLGSPQPRTVLGVLALATSRTRKTRVPCALGGRSGRKRSQLVLTLADHPVARLGHLVPGSREISER